MPSILGIVSGVAIGKITEYYTSTEHKPIREELSGASKDGVPFEVTLGEALASRSTLAPVSIIGMSLLISYALCGVYEVAIASLGMLSFVATTVSIDAFATVSLIQAYAGAYSPDPLNPVLNAAIVKVLVGMLFGSTLVSYFEGLLGKNTIASRVELGIMLKN